MIHSTEEILNLEEGGSLKLDWGKLQKVVAGGVEVLPVVVQDVDSKEVLTLAYVNREALHYTLEQRRVAFYSTSRNTLWVKGHTSGDTLELVEARVNCEQNSLLFLVRMLTGRSCHTLDREGHHRQSCYYRRFVSLDQLEHIEK